MQNPLNEMISGKKMFLVVRKFRLKISYSLYIQGFP